MSLDATRIGCIALVVAKQLDQLARQVCSQLPDREVSVPRHEKLGAV
jgi:hypothetical protein